MRSAYLIIRYRTFSEMVMNNPGFTRLYQLDCVDVASFPAAFYGALIPADFGTLLGKLIVSNKLLDFSE